MEMKKRYWIAGTATAVATAAIATKLLTRPREADWAKYRDSIFHSEHSRFADVDGIRVHYQEAGDTRAPAMVLIHGFASSTLVWSKVFLNLAEAGYRVIALDLPPFGFSDRPGTYTREAQATRINEALARLGVAPAIIVGHSFGAGAATELVMRHPERVRGLVLVDAALGLTAAPSQTPAVLRPQWVRESLIALTVTNPLMTRTLLQ